MNGHIHVYAAHGLAIHSAIALSELPPGQSDGVTAAVRVRLGPLTDRPAIGPGQDYAHRASPQEVRLTSRRFGAMSVRRGQEIIVDPLPSASAHALRAAVLGPGLTFLLHQRGRLVLHASAVAMEGRAVAMIGDPGHGKSTLAAALHDRGHEILADDMIAVDLADHMLVHPGFPLVKLWPDVIAFLGADTDELPPIGPDEEKHTRAAHRFARMPVPLVRIYVLCRDSHATVRLLDAKTAFAHLIRQSLAAPVLQATGTAERHFEQCADLLRRIPISALGRGQDLADLPRTVAAVEADVARPAGEEQDAPCQVGNP